MEAFGWQFELTRPAWLAALGLLPLVVLCSRRRLTGFSRARQGASIACRILLIAAIVLALCGVRAVRPTAERFLVLAIDNSDSIADESRRVADTFRDQVLEAAGRDRVAVVPFARHPAATNPGRVLSEHHPSRGEPVVSRTVLAEHPTAELDTQGTDLAAAIELASALMPSGYVPHVVLLTDGVQTDGDALQAARAAGVPISTVPLESRAEPEVYVSAVRTKGQVQEGEPFYVEVVVHSSHDDKGKVTLLLGDRLAGEKPAAVAKGDDRIRFSQSVTGERLATFTARIEGFRDTLPENNSANAVVFTTARPRVLLVESEALLARHLAAALKNEGIDVEVRRPDEMPKSAAEFEDYELLVLSNVPATLLSQHQMDLMRTYVRDFGGGLIVVGGDQAFTPGGYRNTTLEEILPVWCEFEKTEERPSLAMVLVIDRSESMEQGGAIELAKEATRRAVNLLEPKDQIGVIAFQDYAEWVSQVHPCSDKEHVLERIDTITAGGGTNMLPAVERAYLALRDAFTDLKHVIILTDGVSHPGDFDSLVTRMAESGITVSTVAVGREAVRPLLEDIARIGKGHSYYCDDAEAVPRIFALETASASKMGIVEQPFRPQMETSLEALSGVDLSGAPSLLGYVQTCPKPTSQLVMTSAQGEPLLIWWRYGLGVTVAFTSDIQSRWAAAWLRWPGFSRFWAQLVRHAIRKDQAKDFVLRVAHKNRRATVTLEAVDSEGRYLNGAEALLTVIDPERTSRQLTVGQVAPGCYAVEFATPKAGTYYLELSLKHRGRLAYVQRRGLAVGYSDEYRTRPSDHGLLRAIAEATKGAYNLEPAAVVAPSQKTVPRTTLLWPYFLSLAAMIFVVDVATRRIPRRRLTRA